MRTSGLNLLHSDCVAIFIRNCVAVTSFAGALSDCMHVRLRHNCVREGLCRLQGVIRLPNKHHNTCLWHSAKQLTFACTNPLWQICPRLRLSSCCCSNKTTVLFTTQNTLPETEALKSATASVQLVAASLSLGCLAEGAIEFRWLRAIHASSYNVWRAIKQATQQPTPKPTVMTNVVEQVGQTSDLIRCILHVFPIVCPRYQP